jgi:hypothetical protein
MKSPATRRFAEINKEWWVLLSLVVIAAVLNLLSQRNEMLLGLFTLPTLFSAYFYGRKHATLTALASVLLVVIGYFFGTPAWLAQSPWYDVSVWGALLVVTGYAVGTLFRELHETYVGILLILEHLIARDATAQDHALRVCSFATAIAEEMDLDDKLIEDIHTTALLHDITKLGISREIMNKTAQITAESGDEPRPAGRGGKTLSLLKRVVPILIASQFPQQRETEQTRLAAQIINIADEYELLTSDRDGRNPLPESTATKILTRNLQSKYDPKVLDAFLEVVEKGALQTQTNP